MSNATNPAIKPGSHYAPIWFGKWSSLSSRLWAQFISVSTYSGADSFVGRLYFTPSSHRYSYLPRPWSAHSSHTTFQANLGPADMIGHCDGAGRFNMIDLRLGKR